MTTINKEIESFILLKEITDSRKQLESILEKYNVSDPEEIETQIRDGSIPEHPAYEDYLSASVFRDAIEEMKSAAKQLIDEF